VETDNDLLLIVRVNEDVKIVVGLAHSINLLAINAILLSRRAGARAAGFGVIADELREFSKSLTRTMKQLMQLSYELIGIASRRRRALRLDRLLKMTAAATGVCIGAGEEELQRDELKQTYQRLQSLILDALEAARFGGVIARSLKIEAAYGGELAATLAQIALEFSRSIDEIPDVLQTIQKRMQPTS